MRCHIDDDLAFDELGRRVAVIFKPGERVAGKIDHALGAGRAVGFEAKRHGVVQQGRFVGGMVGVNEIDAADHRARAERHAIDELEAAARRLFDNGFNAPVEIGLTAQNLIEAQRFFIGAATQLAKGGGSRRVRCLAQRHRIGDLCFDLVGQFDALDGNCEFEGTGFGGPSFAIRRKKQPAEAKQGKNRKKDVTGTR